MNQITEEIQVVLGLAAQTSTDALGSRTAVNQVVARLNDITERINQVADSVVELNSRSKQITDAVQATERASTEVMQLIDKMVVEKNR